MVIINLVNLVFRIYSTILVIYALMTWLPGAQDSQLGKIITQLARPYLDFFDRWIPSIGGISFSVIIGLIVLQFIQRGLISLLISVIF
ncbi:YggT family protein [Hutsoniella sourekii]|uniref:YggT family protein n=1 Tax=Hutsoniella sourekii TaxID=87650 RepID=UPI0004825D36|nr:YggT family protein [Hutsoniella sourekii]